MLWTITGDKNQVSRRTAIIEILENSGELRVADLSKHFNVSPVTIRKDLEELEQMGFLARTHGGAKRAERSLPTPGKDRRMTKQEEKQRIARAAADLVDEGDFVIMNGGSTCGYVCEELKKKNRLTLVTNAVQILHSVVNCPHIATIFLGGRFHNDLQITVGDDVNEQLGKYMADKLFLGMDGVSAAMGATTYNHVEDFVMRHMITQSKERILVADNSKIGKVTFARIAGVEEFSTLITNATSDNEEELERIEALGVRVIRA